MRELNYFVATTIDGYIAHSDHSHGGFLHEGDHVPDFLNTIKTADSVLMGARTYEVGLRVGVTNPYPWARQYVVSQSLAASPDQNVTLVKSDPVAFTRELKQAPGTWIYLCGGAQLATALFAANLVDRLTLKINPVAFGKGIRLFTELLPQTELQLLKSTAYANGVVVVHYRVNH